MKGTVVEAGADARTTSAGNLTDTSFWEDYWGRFSLPDAVDERRSFDRALAKALRRRMKGARGSVLEVGCAPGRWLAWMSKEFGISVAGIEFTADGAAATRRNLSLLGVNGSQIRQGDFLAATPESVYDFVVSFGFVEHFTDVESVICRHAAWARPGGRVIIGVPNFRGIHGWMQGALDRVILERHNIEIMDLRKLTQIGEQCGLVTESVQYLGSLEPSLPISRPGVHRLSELFAKILLRAMWLLRRAPIVGTAMDRLNNSVVSSYILASYRKPQ